MVPSKYNFFVVGSPGNNIVYNSKTNALALIDDNKLQGFHAFEKGDISHEQICDVDDWIKAGCLVESHEIEAKEIELRLWKSRYSTQAFSLTIAPTLGCNFRCIYCYEKASYDSLNMPKEVQDAILTSLENKLPTISEFTVAWYGGEPLLAMDIITSLSEKFIKKCEEADVGYSAGIVTNGYLLSPEMVNKFKDLKINSVQVTVDGIKEIHDSRRPLASGQPTFEKIIDNIIECSKIVPISLRVNIDRSNIQKNDELLEYFKSVGIDNCDINIYLGWVESSNGCYDSNTCLSLVEYSDERLRFASKLLELGFHYHEMSDYPTLFSNVCCADQINTNVIAPNGDLYSCWGDIGIESLKMGSILDRNILGNKNRYFDYMLYNPLADVECRECRYLPVCMGGCPKRRVEKNNERCTHVKSKIESYLKMTAMLIKDRKENTSS